MGPDQLKKAQGLVWVIRPVISALWPNMAPHSDLGPLSPYVGSFTLENGC